MATGVTPSSSEGSGVRIFTPPAATWSIEIPFRKSAPGVFLMVAQVRIAASFT
ncbi:MAG: hypothetical protein IANPNBLG_01889 [Bryobacteraceae bacterium]|nr:hypothetical protein [Bryobacteraceae bacterium]